MKRLFGLIGFTFLFVLSAVFYSDFNEIVFAIIGSLGLLSVAVGIFLIISKKNKSFGKSLCVFAFAVIYSAGNMIAYSEYINNTIINKYSDKEITASGYICDEIITTDSSCSFVIKTDKINGQPSDAKIQIISYSNVDAEPFEKVNFTAHTYKNNVNSQISHGIFLKAYSYDGFKIDATGEKVFDLYSFAVEVRMTIKNSLDMLLPEDYSTLCRAVLLGEKTAVAFNRISPTVILVSLLCEPFVSALLVCSLLCSVLFICPFISFFAYPFGLVSGLCSKAILWLVSTFSQLPFSTVKTHSLYWFVWIGVSVLLAIGGLFVINRKFYVRISVSVSISVLVIGASLNVLLTADNGEMKIYNVGNGVFATVNCPDSCSMISCGGNRASADDVTADISERYSDIEYMIIPNQNNKYSSLERFAVTKFDLNNILVYDNDIEKQNLLNAFDGYSRQTFGGNSHFTLNLSDTVTDEVICVDNTMFQFIKGKNMTVLFVPTDADLSNLPEKYRNPDCLLIDSVPENFDLISCNTVIFSGSEKQFKKNYDSIKEISPTVISTSERNITVNLNGG